MSKKIFILGINSSARKNGNTAELLKKVLDYAKKQGARTEIVHLIDKDIKPCLSCLAEDNCKYPCNIKDGMQEIFKLLKRADCLILGSPTYWYNVSGLMKNFIDRLTAQDMLNPPILDGKVVGFVSTVKYGRFAANNYSNVNTIFFNGSNCSPIQWLIFE